MPSQNVSKAQRGSVSLSIPLIVRWGAHSAVVSLVHLSRSTSPDRRERLGRGGASLRPRSATASSGTKGRKQLVSDFKPTFRNSQPLRQQVQGQSLSRWGRTSFLSGTIVMLIGMIVPFLCLPSPACSMSRS